MPLSNSRRAAASTPANAARLLIVFVLALSTAVAQPIGTPSRTPDAATFQDFCGAAIVNGKCTRGLYGDETVGEWTLRDYRLGHFISPESEDAILTTITVFPEKTDVATWLCTRKAGRWEISANLGRTDIRDCILLRVKTGVDRLVCMERRRNGRSTGVISALSVDGEEFYFAGLVQSISNIEDCYWQERPDFLPIEIGVFDKLEAGAPGGPDLIVRARHGERKVTKETERQCIAALAKKPGAVLPVPRLTAMRLEFVFDGKTFSATPETRAKLWNQEP